MSSAPRFVALLMGVAAAAMLWPAVGAAQAQEGRLDPAYGANGLAMTALDTAGVEPDVEITVDGASAFVADGLEGTAIRLSQSGRPFKGFGQDGRFVVAPGTQLGGVEGREFLPRALTVDHRSRIVAFGAALDTKRQSQGAEGGPVSPSLAAVLRFKTDGELDPSFSGGTGYSTGRFGLAPELLTGFPRIGALAGRVDAMNRPVFVVGQSEKVEGCYAKGTVERVPRAVVRLSATGRPDWDFAGDGATPIFGSGEFPTLGIDRRDQPVVGIGNVGSYAAACGEGSILYRFRRDGSLSSDGKQVLRSMHLAIVEPSGATVLAENRGSTLEVARLLPDGHRRHGFGRDGVARVRLPRAAASRVLPAAVDGHGRILLVGSTDAKPRGRKKQPKRSSFVVGRLLPDGRIDHSFGSGGWLFTQLPGRLELLDVQATFDSKGRLLVAGFVSKSGRDNGSGGFAVARYLVGP